jgi:hypothetical protein
VSKKLFSITVLVLFILVCSQAPLNRNTFFASASEPSNLKLYVGPTSVLADNDVYDSIFVQLRDSKGAPARAQQDTTIHLSSSLISIGTVDPVITIPADSTYASANFYSTYTPGTTIITATASGYTTVQTSITTVGPVPSKLAVYSFTPTIPADGGSYPAVVVQLQDHAGSPAKAPIGDVNVELSSSNVKVGTVVSSVAIKAGNTYAVANFTTTNAAGSADITALTSGYSSGLTTITTQQIGGQAANLKIYVEPPSVPADGVTYRHVAVQLQDSSGKIAQAAGSVTIDLSSSDTAVGTVDPTTTIGPTGTYALANFRSTYKSGTTTITAAATNCRSSQAPLTTVGPIPSKLAVYCVPSFLPADNRSYDAIIVQLQDSGGKPARDPSGSVTVHLSSSKPETGNVSATVTIPYGKTHSAASFFSTYTAGSTTITALTSDYESGQSKVTTYIIDQITLNVSVTAQPATVSSGEQATISVYVAYNGSSPAPGVNIQLTSDNGGSFSAPADEGNGYYTSVFTAPSVTKQTVCTILAKASEVGYNSGQATVQVTVDSIIHTGNILLHIKDDSDNALSEADITSTTQPPGIIPLSGITDDNGTLAFNNVLEGSYTFQITKSGYDTTNETITVTASQTADQTINLSKTPSLLPPLPILIAIIAIVIAIVLIIIVIRRRRISSSTSPSSTSEKEAQQPATEKSKPTEYTNPYTQP